MGLLSANPLPSWSVWEPPARAKSELGQHPSVFPFSPILRLGASLLTVGQCSSAAVSFRGVCPPCCPPAVTGPTKLPGASTAQAPAGTHTIHSFFTHLSLRLTRGICCVQPLRFAGRSTATQTGPSN